MTLEEILAKIESDELKEAVVEKINEEKEKGINSYNKKDKEVLKYKTALKKLGYDHEKYDDVDNFIDTVNTEKKTVTEKELTIATLNDKINEITSKLEEEKAATASAKKKAKVNKITADLTKEIGGKFYGSKYLIKDLIDEGRVDLDESTNKLFFKNGDDVLPFDKGLKQLEEENKDMLKAKQIAGTSDQGGESLAGMKVTTELLDKPADAILDELGL